VLGARRHGGDLVGGLERLALDLVARAPPGRALAASVAASGAGVGLGVGGALRAFLLGDQGLPVGDRDLIVVRMDFAEGEETVAVSAVVDEGGLQRSCLRLADSKSNSSTRLPRRTTTRVSSGWVASMSILLGIEQSLDGRPAHGRPSSPRGRRKTARPGPCLTVVERIGRERARGNRIGVAARRGVVASAMGLVLDARS
jgi:hypothetical protein